jgi:Zn-dependent peptidase ImmA (M78 family)/transcriptional regulator with XRE-family HTH domain
VRNNLRAASSPGCAICTLDVCEQRLTSPSLDAYPVNRKGVSALAVSDRLMHARKLRGLSQRALAALAGVSAQAISKYERGLDHPGSQVLIRLARSLDLKPSYFLCKEDLLAVEWLACRARTTVSDVGRGRIVARARDVLERRLAVKDALGMHPAPSQMPTWSPCLVCCPNDAEQAAVLLREAWQLGSGPVPYLSDLLEDHGILVAAVKGIDEGDFDAAALRLDDGLLAIALNVDERLPGDRQRFSMCHELGHLLLEAKAGVNLEAACDRFAGALLAPAESVRRELGTSRSTIGLLELHALKHKYGLSMQGWLYRARQLGVITVSEHLRLREGFRRRGWSTMEPGHQVPGEQVRRLEQLVGHALAEGLVSRSRAAELLGRGIDPLFQ